MMRLLALVVLMISGLGLGGCAEVERRVFEKPDKPETHGVLPYRFMIAGFMDDRQEQSAMVWKPFNQEYFLAKLQENLKPGLFGAKPATLRLKLMDYQESHFERDFAVSLKLHLLAKSDLGRVLVDEDVTCTQDHYGSPKDLPEIAGSVMTNPIALTVDGWEDKIKKELLAKCAAQVANGFSRAVIRGTPSGW